MVRRMRSRSFPMQIPSSGKLLSRSDDEDDLEEMADAVRVKVGICAMNKKTYSRPMKEVLKRLKRFFLLEFEIFPDEVVLNEPVENWPVVDCLISFYSKGFPLNKAVEYAALRKPFLVNDLEMQYLLQDRRQVYKMLEEDGIHVPRYAVLNRDSQGLPLPGESDIIEGDDQIEVNGSVFVKPFVEKPVNAEDHNIYIYYPSSAGGGCQILFRKIGSRSSVYSSESRVRRTGSYIYEDFMATDGTDVKVYTIGEEYAHAEARKSPALDGKVERDSQGKEIRYPVILSAEEKLVAKRVCKLFKQTVCGFDLLRTNEMSLVCDVNGFSFVKTSQKYYDDCSQLLADIILQNLAPQLWTPQPLNFPAIKASSEVPVMTTSSTMLELRCVVAVIRHGDRTPKQKMKMVVRHPKFLELFEKYGGPEEGTLKLKKPSQLQEILDVTRALLDESEPDLEGICENKQKLNQMKAVLEMYGHFSGINRKVQMKSMTDARNIEILNKFKGRNRKSACPVDQDSKSLLLILKWGGELTPMGKQQAEDLGKAFRCIYPGGQGEYGRLPGFGFLRLHSTYRHDLKIYSSDEGRVQMTAAAFAKGLLALDCELTPILVHLVKSDRYVTEMLDATSDVALIMQRVKSRLHDMLHSKRDFTQEDEKMLAPTGSTTVVNAIRHVKNPHQMCQRVYDLVQSLCRQIRQKCEEPNSNSLAPILYHDESLDLMQHRWNKLEKDFKTDNEFDISLIPDIYDCVKYDYLHNRSLGLSNLAELYRLARNLADIVVPQEYGITMDEKVDISKKVCNRLFKKIRADLHYNVDQLEGAMHRLDPSDSRDIASPHRHVRTRLYFTSESHVHSVLAALRYCRHFKMMDSQWKRAHEHLQTVSELNYLTQIVFLQYEDPMADPLSPNRFHTELFFSPGVRTPDTEALALKLSSESCRSRNVDAASSDEALKTKPSSAEKLKIKKMSLDDSELLRERPLVMKFDQHHLRASARQRCTSGDSVGSYGSSSALNCVSSTGKAVSAGAATQGLVRHKASSMSSKPAAWTSTSPIKRNVADTMSIRGAEVYETVPCLHPLVALHSAVTQPQMDVFLDEMTNLKGCTWDYKSADKSDHQSSLNSADILKRSISSESRVNSPDSITADSPS